MPGGERAQGLMEYAALIAALCVAVVSMQLYTKRAVQGRLRVSADAISGAAEIIGSGLTDRLQDQEAKLRVGRSAVPGQQFSAAWSDYSVMASDTERSRQAQQANGESVRELLDTAVTRLNGFVDDFSDKRLIDEKLLE